ncbi:ABC transporter permease [Acetanaerobacterium elongatum]|uniref:Putative ABC transport system permease protein n=1 Tax=Acetanaerobacterium elongatum TaxID=258515 RepID=A0A1G9VLL4_9FIRM|nr:ABC transporter permease [Acetanaerobacterium elongatum]SDM73148.1 putative ABC transport system permease protein [Acetanaerobacterium elongatum]
MNLFDNVKMALKSIFSNKMRSVLTMLGIVIGIASVIMIISAGSGAQNKLVGEISKVGKAAAFISVNNKKASTGDYITLKDIEAIQQGIPYVVAASPDLEITGSVVGKTKDYDAMFVCGTEQLPNLAGLQMISGRYYSKSEYEEGRNVCIIDEGTATKVFGSTDVLGLSVNISIGHHNAKLRIVGVSQNNMFAGGMSVVYVPYSAYLSITGDSPDIYGIYVLAESDKQVDSMCKAALNILERRHNNKGDEIYSAENMNKYVDTLNTVLNLFQTFVAAVAGISLLVGGIGVMNIMLVAVTERTREIGIRKSLGARTKVIMFQFLTESAILTLIGGAAGVLLGTLGALLVCTPLGVTPVLTPGSILLTMLFSCSVGIFFGLYPARKAARLNPIEALRHE